MKVRSGARPAARWRLKVLRMVAAVGAIAATVGVSGCFTQVGAAPPIQIATAFVPVPKTPGSTVAYAVIRNNGPADQLIAAHTSVGGRVVFRAPAAPGSTASKTVSSIFVPANGTLSMAPDSYHMLITGAGAMRGGKDIILTLVFARAGPLTVVAQVTNPESGGSSYFLN